MALYCFAALLAVSLQSAACTEMGKHRVPASALGSAREAAHPAEASRWHRVLADTLITGDVVVPDGERWLIGRNVQVRGNVRTHHGTIAMRPGSSLRFVGADPARYVGGGMHFTPGVHDQDWGLWIGAGHSARGRLDIQCTPKTGWNRTGSDPTWRPSDEYWIAPAAEGDLTPRRWQPGQPIPRRTIPAELHSRLAWVNADWRAKGIPTEIVNVTRDCVIEGPGHIHIHSTAAQRIEYVQLRRMGVRIPGKQDSGRYALHLHMMGEGSRGTVVRGVASLDSGNRVFVPHMSHGVSFIDNVAVNSTDAPFWWDIGQPTHDLLIDRLAVLGVVAPNPVPPAKRRLGAVILGTGENMTIRNSVVAGLRHHEVPAFDWPEGSEPGGLTARWAVEDVVSHNNRGAGMRPWIAGSDGAAHEVRRYISYNDGMDGRTTRVGTAVRNGSYDGNNFRFVDLLVLNGYIAQRSGARAYSPGQAWINVTVHNPGGIGALYMENRNVHQFTEWEKCHFGADTKVVVNVSSSNPGKPHRSRFRDCGLTPDDIVIQRAVAGSQYEIWEKGRHRWTVAVDSSGQKVVTSF